MSKNALPHTKGRAVSRECAQLLIMSSLLLGACEQGREEIIVEEAPKATSSMSVQNVQNSLKAVDENEHLNAFVHVDSSRALKKAEEVDAHLEDDLPLRGVVIAVKDNIHVAGMPNAVGTYALRDFVPEKSSSVVVRLEAAGAVVLGKTGMHELAYGVTSNNFEFGAVRNPVDPSKTPGGSSGGSASAVGAGLVSAALGTDTGASVRLPAALCGIVGFRPTVGRYASDGVSLISPTRDTIGFLAKTVEDVVLLDSIAVGQSSEVPAFDLSKLRLGVPLNPFYENLDPEVAKQAKLYLKALEGLGVELVYADLSDLVDLNAKVGFPVVLYETSKVLPEYLIEEKTGVTIEALLKGVRSPDVKTVMEAVFGGAINEDEYLAAINEYRPALIEVYNSYFKDHTLDAIIFPTSPITARNIEGILEGVTVNGELKDTFATYIQNTDAGSNAGLPGISIPISPSDEGLPIGMELDALAGDDEKLLSIGLAIELALSNRNDTGE